MTEPMNIYFMRHAESAANVQDSLAARRELPTLASGTTDADMIGATATRQRLKPQ